MVRVWAQMAHRLTPKVVNFVPGSPIALEGVLPTGGLLAGIVCLPPTLADAGSVVAHVLGNTGDEGLNLLRALVPNTFSLQSFSDCPTRKLKRQHCGPKQGSCEDHNFWK